MASRGINKVIVVGNLGADPEMRYMPNGGAVCELSIATSETWKDKNTGQQQERTEWHRVTAFARLAEIMGEYLRKGSQVYIEGSLRTEKYQDKSGNDRYSTKIVAREMQMLGGRASGGSADFNGGNKPAGQATNRPAGPAAGQGGQGGQSGQGNYQQPPQQAPSSPEPAMNDFDDDIPF